MEDSGEFFGGFYQVFWEILCKRKEKWEISENERNLQNRELRVFGSFEEQENLNKWEYLKLSQKRKYIHKRESKRIAI